MDSYSVWSENMDVFLTQAPLADAPSATPERKVDDLRGRRLRVHPIGAAGIRPCDLLNARLSLRRFRRQGPQAPHQFRKMRLVVWRRAARKVGVVSLHVEQFTPKLARLCRPFQPIF